MFLLVKEINSLNGKVKSLNYRVNQISKDKVYAKSMIDKLELLINKLEKKYENDT